MLYEEFEKLGDCEVSDLSLSIVEFFIGKRLPQDYKDFLKKSNGILLEGVDFNNEEVIIKGNWFDLPRYNTIRDPGVSLCLRGFYSLQEALETFKVDCGKNFVYEPPRFPIAFDYRDNCFYIELDERDYGNIRFMDLWQVYHDENDEEVTITEIIAPSFTDFVSKLRPGKEEDRDQ